jgi:hypothetical protein
MNDYVYFAFIDVLGYKNYLAEDIKSNNLNFKDRLQSAFQIFNEINGSQFHYQSISDSIFIHSNSEDPTEFLYLLKKIFVSFVTNGLLIRGGVSYNRHFENPTITYSLALTDAYQLESSEAVFPRILIHQSIIEKLRNHHATGKKYLDRIVNAELLLQDGYATQLHILDEDNWNTVYSGCQKIYNENSSVVDSSSTLRLKHIWLQNYLFAFKPKNCRKSRYISELTKFSI